MSRHGLTALATVIAASSAAAQTTPDPAFCDVLQDCVTSRRGEAKEVIFRTSWGRGFNDSPERLYEKRCHHHDDEPSVKLCGYLAKHGGAWVEASFGDDLEVGGKAFRLQTKGYQQRPIMDPSRRVSAQRRDLGGWTPAHSSLAPQARPASAGRQRPSATLKR